MSRTAAAFLRQAMCLLGTALHRAHAMRVHSAARDLAGFTPAGGRPGVGALPIGVRMALPPPAAGIASFKAFSEPNGSDNYRPGRQTLHWL